MKEAENQSLPDLLARKELLPSPCPLCGDDVAKGSFWFSAKPRAPDAPELYEVFCLECEFDGPSRPTLDEAIEAWNRRASSPDLLARLREEKGWLIEGRINRHWYGGIIGWTYDHDQAVRFCRKRDAECTISALGLIDHFAAEHVWVAPARAVRTPLKKEEDSSGARVPSSQLGSDPRDLAHLEEVARAADNQQVRAHEPWIAFRDTFDPPTVLRLIELAKGVSGKFRCKRCGRDEIDARANGCERGPCPMEPQL